MIDVLRHAWRGDSGMDELVALAQRLDRLLLEIHTQRGIRPATILCPKCGQRGPAAAPRVSVRAAILAAGRFGIGTQAEIAERERRWNRQRSQEALDLYGKPAGASDRSSGEETDGCAGHGS